MHLSVQARQTCKTIFSSAYRSHAFVVPVARVRRTGGTKRSVESLLTLFSLDLWLAQASTFLLIVTRHIRACDITDKDQCSQSNLGQEVQNVPTSFCRTANWLLSCIDLNFPERFRSAAARTWCVGFSSFVSVCHRLHDCKKFSFSLA